MKAVNDAHELEYGEKPDSVAKAPGRFHLIGEHSWFFKDKTMSMAVNLPVYVAISKREDTSREYQSLHLFHQLVGIWQDFRSGGAQRHCFGLATPSGGV